MIRAPKALSRIAFGMAACGLSLAACAIPHMPNFNSPHRHSHAQHGILVNDSVRNAGQERPQAPDGQPGGGWTLRAEAAVATPRPLATTLPGRGNAVQPQPNQQAPTAPQPPAAPGTPGPGEAGGTPAPQSPQTSPGGDSTGILPYPTARLRVRVIDGRTMNPLSGAEVVLIETEERHTTGPDGWTTWFRAPVIRNPRYRPMVAELHGQLGVIAYKNGYRDSIHLGIRMHEGYDTEATVWMYKLGPGDTRIEPVLYQVPFHHLWLVQLADKFRSKTQPGEGPERP